ncbi:nanoRNase/pAp phosphatase (c-di-AMP/oligoRNAs hydrolase) [Haloarcula quadrata]|jgi:nanoRNase/pAp phosphatase (c-di-AMP/oligoRNAs hydrolase)|uniref:Bifunctional oligoribonuclease/PAP phosphatase NrnA n=2 Tax=Haloarcula TaxID=2237 RepID=Q5V2P1_HALMA|nr:MULTISPECIES: DHH family phosphoesterase [Haloarcula]AAV46211.1 unknown [Haloarcula marismortui ATCC 43049]NHN64053.1 bifunctional oligoribonuclease/PAP phosphatase NrnA [Haloarcula sp. JP-Z28]QCP90963.1 bifunctional oligoribonuclease/PAP phosphatase NrnA [Haloarcula marismortui ATCC 43049]RKS82956.1 nanoRNase/pAp phosphatase (c-di-AMP/oligoRNAs hydrolase) [Haloarcula quadrata]
MLSRLVLGLGPTAADLLDAISDDRGELAVVTQDEHRAETLRADGINVLEADQADPSVLADLDFHPESIIVASEDPKQNADAATAARDCFPDAFLLAYAGHGATTDQRDRLDSVADRLVTPETVVTDYVTQSVGDEGTRARQLHQVLRDIDDHLAVVMHDNPDPDAIASAVALGALAERADCEVTICYYGEISHQENRAFVNLLEFDLRNLDADSPDELEAFDAFALVDHSRAGVNDQLPPETPIDIVIDHHPPRVPIEARFVDLRSGVGATSTLLVDYLQRFNVDIPTPIATGLLFGIQVDTKDFRREVAAADFEAAAHLVTNADMATLQRIEDPSVSPETLSVIGRAITNRDQEGSVLLTGVGEISDRDALAQAADRLLDLEGVQTTMVYGVVDGTIYVSARARGADIDLGEALRDAFGQIGSAGGHADMAGAQIDVGMITVDDREESLEEIVRAIVSNRFLDAVQSRSHRLLGRVYARADYDVAAFTESTALSQDSDDTSATAEGASGEAGDDGTADWNSDVMFLENGDEDGGDEPDQAADAAEPTDDEAEQGEDSPETLVEPDDGEPL